MVILSISLLPVCIAVTGFLVLKSVHLGLRWQGELRESRPPTMDSPVKPLVDHIERKEEQKQMQMNQTVLDEWLNGTKEG